MADEIKGDTSLEAGKAPQYTQEQVDKLLSDAKAAGGRASKAERELTLAAQRASNAEAALAESQRQRDEAELGAAQDDPVLLTAYQKKQALREREAKVTLREREMEAQRLEMDEALKVVHQFNTEKAATEIVKKPGYEGVDPKLLVSLTDGTPEKMEALAKALKPSTPAGGTPPGPLPPDSGASSGGGGTLTIEQVKQMSREERVARSAEIAKLPLSLGSEQ